MTREEWVVKNISDYLEMDLVSFLNGTDAIVYGGAVRDSLAFLPIQDVDIALLPESLSVLERKLTSFDWKAVPKYTELSELLGRYSELLGGYEEVKIIFKCKMWTKNERIIQLICPDTVGVLRGNLKFYDDYYLKVKQFVGQVDFSNCGVCYDNKTGLNETIKGAFADIKYKTFRALERNSMYEQYRSGKRKNKFIERGWKFLK